MKYHENTDSEATAITVFKDMLKSYQPSQSLRSIEKICDIFNFLFDASSPRGENDFELAIEKFIIPFIVIVGTLEDDVDDLISNCKWINYCKVNPNKGVTGYQYSYSMLEDFHKTDKNNFINKLSIKGSYSGLSHALIDTKFIKRIIRNSIKKNT